ncbi:hypothetical protein [Paenibacillus pinistramenti]|uniref:hypothetical protein n=1 Tax=Paenibacillus pinistramenti TaxID=1768003 RepID=UPI0011091A4E|nr:hypothetical protein [Paenibacillus pinistramenti]
MTKMKSSTITAGVLGAALLSCLLPASQAAYGKEVDSNSTALLSTSAGESSSTSTAAVPDAGSNPSGQTPERNHHPRRHFFGGYAIKTTADMLGMDKTQLIQELKAGRTLMQIVKEKKGWSESEYISKLTDASSKKIDQAVKDGKLDADRAAKLKAAFPAKFKEVVNRNWTQELDKHDSKTGGQDGIFRQHEAKLQESN